MKNLFLALTFLLIISGAIAQSNEEKPVKKSPYVITFCGTNDESIILKSKIEDILECSIINVTNRENAAESFDVKSYAFVFAPKVGQAYFESVTGNEISETIKTKLRQAIEGDLVIITEVKIQTPEGIKMIPGPECKIK